MDSIAGGRKLVAAALVVALCTSDLLPRLPLWLGTSVAKRLGGVRVSSPGADEHRAGELAWHEADFLSAAMLRQGANPLLAQPWISDYAAELTADYDGPVEAVIRHLRQEAAPGEAILVQYEHYPFMFYTDLQVVRWDEAASLERLPEWIFFHGLRQTAAGRQDPQGSPPLPPRSHRGPGDPLGEHPRALLAPVPDPAGGAPGEALPAPGGRRLARPG